MRKWLHKILVDESGVATMEFSLLLLTFGLPLILLCRMLLAILAAQYELVTFYETLPFP